MTTYVNPGLDASGNGNNWTTNNINWTSSGSTYDSMTDVPTLTSATTANFCVLNPLSATSGTFSNANLQYVGPSGTRRANSTVAVSTGKWYWEVTLTNAPESPRSSTTPWNAFGFGLSTTFGSTTGTSSVTDALFLADNGYYKNFSGAWTDSGVGFASGDVLAIAVDLDANTFAFYKNNTSIITGTIGGTVGRELTAAINSYAGTYGTMACNFGQRPFAYTPPTGYVALNTYNLPTPTIGATASSQANKYFDATLWTGTGASQSIVNSGSFQPDFVWAKSRSGAESHRLQDVLRGATQSLFSNSTSAETTEAQSITSFNSNGFTLGTGTPNTSSVTYVGWQWKANGTGVTNTAGSITSTVSANTTSGFSVVTYTGNAATSATIGHGLGVAPDVLIVKNRQAATTSTNDWNLYFRVLGTGYMILPSTNGYNSGTNRWNGTNPTSTVFSVGGDSAKCNNEAINYVAYCFNAVAGYSAFGKYTGNGSADGTFVYTGFRPKYLLVKMSSADGYGWNVVDAARSPYNAAILRLMPQSSSAEDSGSITFDLLSNGFKVRDAGIGINENGTTYIYMAFAESPFKYANAR